MADWIFEKYRWGWCALAGVLLVLGFPPFACSACGWIALVPAWWVVTRSETVRRQPIRHGYLMGLIYFGGTFWWISDVTPVGTFFLILYLALYPGVWLLLIARLLPAGRGGVLGRAGAAAAFWVTLEWWRSWFLTGFDWNELGATQSPSLVFRQLAAFGGVPLLSFLLAAVNVLWAEGVAEMAQTLRGRRVVRVSFSFGAALVVVAVMFAVGGHHLLRHNGETLRTGPSYACIQPNIPQIADLGAKEFQHSEDVALAQEVEFSQRAITKKPELLVWPEAIVSEGVFSDEPLNAAVHSLLQSFDGWFMLGSEDFEFPPPPPPSQDGGRIPVPRLRGKLYNAAYLFSPGGEKLEEYRKTRLVVLGEYLPFADEFPRLRKWLGEGGINFSTGPGPVKFVMTKPDVTFSPLICFEDTLADVADQAARLRADFFVTITNDGWYTGTFARWGVRQHLALAVFRCVEHDRPMLRCANNGVSCEINQDGTVTDRLHDASGRYIDVGGIFMGTLHFYAAQPTFYEAWGDWIVLISSLVSVMLGFYWIINHGRLRRREF